MLSTLTQEQLALEQEKELIRGDITVSVNLEMTMLIERSDDKAYSKKDTCTVTAVQY